ncbi:MAG: Eco57I restriction-modification methylase domain-containing protein [Bacteroidota bacterium]
MDYLFNFLDAYDFSGEGAEEIQEENKTLINASVLGLIFEKINGYKDGSFFTPGFITMYMCRETIRRAVVERFNEFKGWQCKEFGELYDKIENRKEANEIINPNSVKICRLRLWIELLKHAYYLTPQPPLPRGEGEMELETLPNIDINIKCGNSLISRYALDTDIRQALKRSKWSIDSYRLAVMTYRNACTKEEKREMERLIDIIKQDFESEITSNDKRLLRLKQLQGELFTLTNQTALFERSKKELDEWNKKINHLVSGIRQLEQELEEIKNNKIYENAFEWRFEFPEVLNDDGDFVGFDVVIGNPPYINAIEFKKLVGAQEYSFYKDSYKTAKGTVDIYIYFFEFGFNILKRNQFLCYITPNRYLSANYGVALREHLIKNFKFLRVGDYSNVKVFAEASTYPIVSLFQKMEVHEKYYFKSFTFIDESKELQWREFDSTLLSYLNENILGFILSSKFAVAKKVIDSSENLSNSCIINATSTAGEAEKFHNYINSDSDGFKLINTGTIDRYSTTWGNGELTDKGKKFLTPYLPKKLAILGKNRLGLYNRPKIVLAKIALRTEAFYDEHGDYASINTNCMHSFKPNYIPYYILGWLNSKLFQFVFECFFDGLKMAGGYLLYSAPNLNNLYIKKVSTEDQKPIVDRVSQIQTIKNSNSFADTTTLEKEIDHLVYELYGLTEDEIKIVEGG